MTEKTEPGNKDLYFETMENTGDGTIPMPDHVKKDEKPIEICRVWKLSDDTVSNVTSPYELDGPADWGGVLAGIARSLASGIGTQADEGEEEGAEAFVLNGIVCGFLRQFGIRVAIVPVVRVPESDEPVLDPDKAN